MTEMMGCGPREADIDGTTSAEIKPKGGDRAGAVRNVRTLACRTVATARLQQRHHIRDLPPIGSGAGSPASETLLAEEEEPHPSEMLLAALGACVTAGIQANAVARGIPLRKLEVHSRGEVDPSSLWGGDRRPHPLGFESISIEVHVEADAPRDALRRLVDHAVLWSPVANTLHDPVHLDVALVTE